MPEPRNPYNLAAERAAGMGIDLLRYISKNHPERLGEGPVAQRVHRIGPLPANDIIEALVNMVPEENDNGL